VQNSIDYYIKYMLGDLQLDYDTLTHLRKQLMKYNDILSKYSPAKHPQIEPTYTNRLTTLRHIKDIENKIDKLREQWPELRGIAQTWR